jgi:carbonic anhydrase/acetyltransferase-like protein (isoleucine patch superfamily)
MSAAEELVHAQAAAGRVWLGDLGEAERVLTADFILEFCLGVDLQSLSPRGLWVAGGRVEGVLDFVLCEPARPLAFESMTFDERPNFGACSLPGLAFTECDLPGLAARDLETSHILSLRSCRIDGLVELGRAQIGGDLVLSGAHIKGEGGSALLAGGASVAGDILLDDGFVAEGQIRLVQAKVGADLDCGGATISAPDNDEAVLLGDGAEIHGSVLLTDGFAATGAVRFVAAEIRGALRCSGAELANPDGEALMLRRTTIAGNLGLEGTKAMGEIELVGVSIGDSLIVSGATLDNGNRNALVADGARIARNVEIGDGFASTGTVRLVGARVGGDLHCSAGEISNRSALALVLDRAEIEGNANLDEGFKAEGTVRLVGARVGGELNCGFATLTAERTHALACDEAVVDQNLNLGPGFSANGIVSFVHAKIGGAFDCSAAKLWNPTGIALAADAVEVGASMLLGDEFEAFGEVRMVGARIRSDLVFSGGRFENLHNVALRAAEVDAGALRLLDTRFSGGVSLFKAHAGALHDDLAPGSPAGSWSVAGPLLLAGFSYDRFGPGATWDSNLRFAWLRETEAFDPGAWQQLINVYRIHGRDEDARRAAVAREDDRLKRAGLSRTRKAGRWILRATIGYGYRPWIAGLWAIAVIALFTLALSVGPSLVPEPSVTGSPNLVVYAADTFLPIVDLGEAARWSPVGWLEWIEWLVILLGWALTTIFVAGFTRIVRS